MADDHQQDEQNQTSVSLDQSATNNDMVQNVRELMYKDKSTVLIKAVELLVLNLQQQQVIIVLKQTLQEAIQQKEQMLKDLHDQPVMESLMSNIEAQNRSTRKQLGDKVESINMHMKSNEVLRKQLKKEIMGFRSGIDDVKRQIHEKEEAGKLLHQALVGMLARIEEVSKQLRFASGERAKLREEIQEKMEKIKRMKSSYEEHIKKIQVELTESENVLKQRTEELANVQEQITGKVHAYRQMLSEKQDIQNLSDGLNQNWQTEKAKLEETFAAEKKQLEQLFGEKSDKHREKIEELNQTINSLTNLKIWQEDCIAELDVAISKLVEEITDVHGQNAKLENELAKFGPMENLDSNSEERLKKKQPIVFSGRPRAQVFIKSATHAPSTDNDNDVSCHLDNVQSSISCDSDFRK